MNEVSKGTTLGGGVVSEACESHHGELFTADSQLTCSQFAAFAADRRLVRTSERVRRKTCGHTAAAMSSAATGWVSHETWGSSCIRLIAESSCVRKMPSIAEWLSLSGSNRRSVCLS